MYRKWKPQAEFLTVYIREAHPVKDDESATPTNKLAGIIVKQPRTLEERSKVAERCSAVLNIDTPMVVDTIDNRIAQTYQAMPDRLYVIGRDGRVAYMGGPGPFGFNPYEMEQALMLELLAAEKISRPSK